MTDIREQPYATWLEETLTEIVELNPISIGIILIQRDGNTGTAYFNADNRDRLIMCEAIQQDSLLEFIKSNAELIAGIIGGEEERDDD